MITMDRTDQNINVQIIIGKYFEDNPKTLVIKSGEVLLDRDKPNDKLYLVLDGELVGYSLDTHQGELEMFHVSKGMFAGVYSFFSESYSSSVKLVAKTDSRIAYITRDEIEEYARKEKEDYSREFIPIIVNELKLRHHAFVKISAEKEATLQQLVKTEKLASLGQMAASIAHELNNTISILHHNSQWLAREISSHLKLENELYTYFFNRGLNEGRRSSTKFIRNKQKELRNKFYYPDKLLKKIAAIYPTKEEEQLFGKVGEITAEKYTYYWELGATLHDMLVASDHSRHVVSSVRKLGSPRNDKLESIHINETLEEALLLLSSKLQEIQVDTSFGVLHSFIGGKGELIQVWVNIIKNAVDSLKMSSIKNPVIRIQTTYRKNIFVTIEDNGPGIPPELREKIFRPNFSTKVSGLDFGLGLGLTIVQRIIESYSGHIEVESEPGKTKFTVVLPIGDGDE